MILTSGSALPLLALLWPLLLAGIAAIPRVRSHALRLLPLAPLPALWLALAEADARVSSPDLLLGLELALQPSGRILLGMSAFLWFAAGAYAQAYMKDTDRPAVFAAFWCLTLAGNLGVFLAADVVTFYVAFATVSLAAYVLIVHESTQSSLRAGRLYVAVVILGEVCLLGAFAIGIARAESMEITEIRAALPEAPLGGVAIFLLVAGFGIKAGLMPLHVWLPLAHPAAPTPASAVLSGAMVKAGIMGMIVFLPQEFDAAGWLIAIGLLGAFCGAFLGLRERNPKAILAYSTISQMSLLVTLIVAAPNTDQTAFYALHHGLAKGALFLSVGLVAACGDMRWRAPAISLVLLAAASVAGAPLTGGSVAKLAGKSGLDETVELAVNLTAVSTTLVLGWFVTRLASSSSERTADRPSLLLVLPTLVLAGGALVVPWWLGPSWSGLEPGYALERSSLWSSTWPLVIGLAGVVIWIKGGLAEALPGPGRAAMGTERTVSSVRRLQTSWQWPVQRGPAQPQEWGRDFLNALWQVAAAFEHHLRRGRQAVLLVLVFCVCIILSG